MGSSNSKMRKRHNQIAPLRTYHQRWPSNSTTRSDDSIQYEIDQKPNFLEDELYINLNPQNITLVFSITTISDITHFEFTKAYHRDRYSPITEIMSEQILLPMTNYSRIAARDGILHICRDNDMHIRILERQLNKIWFLEDDQIHITGFRHLALPWSFWITDQNTWSTNSTL